MDSRDVQILLQQSIRNLQFQSGSGQVNLPVLIQLLEMQTQLICQLWDMAQQASTDSRGLIAQTNQINERLATLLQARSASPQPQAQAGGGLHGS